MKPFSFQRFTIQQNKNVFRVGTDAVLLGALANIDNAKSVLEIGSGTGLISLMLAQRNPNTHILALDINPEAKDLTELNFKNSEFSARLQNILEDYKQFNTDTKFDFIISNPPYFEESNSLKDKIARQTVELNFDQLIIKTASLLSEKGIFSVILPFEAGHYFISKAKENKLFLNRKINIFGTENSTIKRLILEFSSQETNLEEFPFIIEKSPRQYSDQYLELTKEFHIFKHN